MKEILNFCCEFFFNIHFALTIALMIIAYIYLNRAFILSIIKKKRFDKLFRLDPKLETEINNFSKKDTKLIFHFVQLSKDNNTYKYLYISSQKKFIQIKNKEFTINYTEDEYPYKYNVSENIVLIDKKNDDKKAFLITVNKYIENHYNIIIDKFKEKKTFSLEVIIYSSIKKCLEEISSLKELKIYIKESIFQNLLRFNIINARVEELTYLYTINMEEEEKLKINKNLFDHCNENLLLNLIYSKGRKIAHRRIFKNKDEAIILNFENKEKNLVKELYSSIIEKYIDADLHNTININKFKNEFIAFDKSHGYSSEIDIINNQEINIKSDLRTIDVSFKYSPFFLRNYGKNDISSEDLKMTEFLCYLNLILSTGDYALDKIQSLNKEKNEIFNKYYTLSNKDKSLILCNLLTSQKKDKANYRFISFYDLPENCPYVQSEIFFRKAVSQLKENSSLSFLYLQMNSGSGEDYITLSEHYKIKIIPLIIIKFHLIKEYFHHYFFTFNSNNNTMALNNKNTQILSFNESKDIGYTEPETLSKIPDENNMIKLAFLKFHEHAHIKFKGNYDYKLAPRYLLNYNFELIDNKYENKNNENIEIFCAGESGNALEFFVFNDYSTLEKLMKSKKDLSNLNNINLLIQDNFDELRNLVQEFIKDVKLTPIYDKENELSKKYKEKIKNSNDFKNKKISEIRLYDLDIEEMY